MNLKRNVFVSSLWSLCGSGGQQLISFLIFIYLARVLTPTDVGLVALGMVFVEVAGFISQLGQVPVLQREPELSDRTLSTSFWMLAATGLLMTGLIAGGAEVASGWWEQPLFFTVLILLSPICAVQALTAVPEGVLKHRFQFRSMAMRAWLATLAGGAVALYMAYRGYAVYALVAQRVVTFFVQMIATWAFLGWRPKFTFDFGEAKRLARSGFEIVAASFAGNINPRLTEGMTGFVLGPAQLGYFRLGWRFSQLIGQVAINPIATVSLTTFSKLQDNVEALRRAYLRMTQFMALASLPMFFGLGAVADVFVPLILGAKWAASIIVIQLLGFVKLPGTVNYFFGSSMIAVGKPRIVLRQSVVMLVVTPILLYIGAQFGLVGVMVALIVRGTIATVYNVYSLNREISLGTLPLVRVLMPPVVACAAMVGAVELAKFELAGVLSGFLLLAALIAIGAVTYGAVLLLGDVIHLWRGYVRGAADSLAGAMPRRGGRVATTPA